MAKKSSKKILTVPKFMKDLTTNKYVLYLVAFVALINLLGYMAMGKNICVLLFILIAVITSYFSKNMIFVLAVPTFLVGFFAVCDAVKSVQEGMKEGIHHDGEEDGDGGGEESDCDKCKEENPDWEETGECDERCKEEDEPKASDGTGAQGKGKQG